MTQTLPQDPAGAVERTANSLKGWARDMYTVSGIDEEDLAMLNEAADTLFVLLTRLEKAEGERDEAKADRKAANDHALEVASEARDGFDALDFMDEAWAATGEPGNRKHLTLAEQISSIVRERDQAEARAEQPWQPIETAPRGKKLLAGYRNALGNWRTVLATYYLAGTLEASEDLDDSLVDEDGCAPEGWYEECETRDDILPCDHDPTHWRPLPEPPRQALEGQP